MSLTAFQRYRRMKQSEEMKPENIQKQEANKEEIVEEPKIEENKEEVIEDVEETKTSARRNKRGAK